MGDIKFREALLDEFEAVQEVFQDVWDMNIIREVYASQIYSENDAVIIGLLEDKIVGVVSSFLSTNKRGKKRWEIDLIAVKKEAQGKGVGTGLIKASIEKGKSCEAKYARGLIRIENGASQKIFEKAQFKKEEGIYSLILWQPWIFKNRIKENKEITYLPMDTLSYRGMWIEDLFAKERSAKEYTEIVNYAQQYVYKERRDNTGATILREDINKLPRSLIKQSANHGKYNWWTMDLNK